jgi:hypothetical protein
MLRRLARSLAALLALAACGGGGGGGSNSSTLTATGAIAVTATQFTSLTHSTTCNVSGVQLGVAFAAVGASDQAGLCGYLQRGQDKQNAKTITVAAVKVNPLGAGSLTPGAYPVTSSPGAQTEYAAVFVSQNDAACTATDAHATSGTVTITSVDGGRVQGTVNATLSNGGTVTGGFDAPACAVSVPGDICTGQVTPPSGACVP